MSVRIITGDCRDMLATLPDASVHCCVTSPPYFGLRDYNHAGQMGLEPTPDEYVAGMVEVFREVKRVLRDDATLWLNIGDSYAANSTGGGAGQSLAALADRYAPNKLPRNPNRQDDGSVRHAPKRVPDGLKAKDLIGIPWLLAFALRADGWYLRQDIIWSKPNPMPESVRDRCTKAHEYMFLLSKSPRYYFDAEAIAERSETVGSVKNTRTGSGWVDGQRRAVICPETRNKRSVWEVATQPFSEAHFATFPPALIEPCILAGCPKDGTVLDPFGGAGTTGLVADRLQRNAILIELNPEYAAMAQRRIADEAGMFGEVMAA